MDSQRANLNVSALLCCVNNFLFVNAEKDLSLVVLVAGITRISFIQLGTNSVVHCS